jgi:hypothetical protein
LIRISCFRFSTALVVATLAIFSACKKPLPAAIDAGPRTSLGEPDSLNRHSVPGAAAACPPRPAGKEGILSHFVAAGTAGAWLARAVVADAKCPAIVVDGKPVAMLERAGPTPPAFPNRVCEATLPKGARSAKLGDRSFVVPASLPARIAVLGDTGCRMKGKHFQACANPDAWPFAKIARAIAAEKPDLVIHVGDYHYREAPCPPGNAACKCFPSGDSWDVWWDDFFEPAAPLLATAPWVFVRGNHESCHRAGAGWMRLLDAQPGTAAACRDVSPAFAVALAGVTLVVLDSAGAHDMKPKKDQIAQYEKEARSLRALAKGPSWVASHKPLVVVVPKRDAPGTAFPIAQRVLNDAFAKVPLPQNVSVWLAGHTHFLQLLGFDGAKPASIVAGHGGTELIPPAPGALVGTEVGGAKITSAKSFSEWGFVLLEREGNAWRVTARDVAGKVRARCQLGDATNARALRCDP